MRQILVFSQHQSVMSLHSEIFSQGLPVRKRYLFSYLHLTTLAFSRLEAMRTTQGNKLMRGDLWKGEWERKKDRFFSAAPSFLFVLLLLPFSSLGSIASALKSRSSHQMTKTLLYTCFILLYSPDNNKASLAQAFFLLWGFAVFFPLCYKQVNSYGLTCSHGFLPKLLYTNWKPMSSVTLKVPFLMNCANK